MTDANEVMNDFMDKLSEGSFEKDNQPDNGTELTPDFVDKQVDSFSRILDSEIIESAMGKSQRNKIYRKQDNAESEEI